MLARQIARDRDEHLLLRRIINKHTVLSQLNAALFRLIPLQLCPRTCLYSRYSRVLDKAAKNCGKGPPPGGYSVLAHTLIGFRNFCQNLKNFTQSYQSIVSIRQITQITPPKTSPKPTITDHTTSVMVPVSASNRSSPLLSPVIIHVRCFYQAERKQ